MYSLSFCTIPSHIQYVFVPMMVCSKFPHNTASPQHDHTSLIHTHSVSYGACFGRCWSWFHGTHIMSHKTGTARNHQSSMDGFRPLLIIVGGLISGPTHHVNKTVCVCRCVSCCTTGMIRRGHIP